MRKPTVVAALIIAAACTDRTPVTPELGGPSASISDALHESGNAHFYFLPPLVPAPSPTGEFDGSLAPVVRICEWTGEGCAEALVAEFTMATGPGSETVRVELEDESYIVNWHTDQFGLDATKTYRIRVLISGAELGHADVDVVASAGEAKNVDTGEFIALVDGRTLPIKFRIEKGIIFIDATALTPPRLDLSGVTAFDSREMLTVVLDPGSYRLHYFTSAGAPGFDFEVTATGLVEYDRALDGFLAGRGTFTLTVLGLPLRLDATPLSAHTISLGGLKH